MKWVFYNCIYGPGSQSQDSGYLVFHDSYNNSDIEDHLVQKYNFARGYNFDYYVMDKPPNYKIKERIKNLKAAIKSHREEIKELEQMEGSNSFTEIGEDTKIQELLENRPLYEVVRKLAANHIYVDDKDVDAWRKRSEFDKKERQKPVASIRDKVIKIIKNVKKYDRS